MEQVIKVGEVAKWIRYIKDLAELLTIIVALLKLVKNFIKKLKEKNFGVSMANEMCFPSRGIFHN